MSPRIPPAGWAGFWELGRMDSFEWNKIIGAVLGSLGCRAVGVEDEGVQRCCYRAVLPQGEHVLAFVEVLVVQHQQSLRMHPAARNPCHAKDVRHDTPGLNQITS